MPRFQFLFASVFISSTLSSFMFLLSKYETLWFYHVFIPFSVLYKGGIVPPCVTILLFLLITVQLQFTEV